MSRLFFFLIICQSTFSFAFDWQGHRGARGLYPENTVGSMMEALKYPVKTLELDVVISKDLKVVVSHEPWMNDEICLDAQGNPFKGKKHNLFNMTYNEILKFDCGSRPHPRFPEQVKVNVGKPLLSTLLDVSEAQLRTLNRTDIIYNIEIKSDPEEEKKGHQPDYKKFSDLVIGTIVEKLPSQRYIIQSFDWRVLQYIHKKYPDIRLSALTSDEIKVEEDLKRLGFIPYVYSPYYKKLTPEVVQELQRKKIKVIPWTVNEVAEMRAIKRMGVDGIITDYPNRIKQAEQKECPKGRNFFEGQCVEIPTHALPSETNPGWICKPGHVQKRGRCVKMVLPPHSHLTPDGKSWDCNEGYTRYRGTCKKD